MSTIRHLIIPPLLAIAGCGGHGGHGGHEEHGGHEGMTDDFSDADRWAKHFDDPSRDAWQHPAEVIRLMEIEPGMTAVDLGAGTGYFLPHLSAAVGDEGRVLALDVEETLVQHMTERASREGLANVVARVIPPDDPQLGEGEVDRVLIVNTWHHLPERSAYAARLARSLRPGGAVFVVDITPESERGPHKRHRIPAETVAETLSGAGLEVSVLEESLPEQYVVRAARP